MHYKDIIFMVKDHIATITLNRPDVYNAISDTMRKELRNAIDIINSNNNIRIVVITGSGKAFSAGGDIKVMKERIEGGVSYRERLETYRRDISGLVNDIKSIKQPIIAALNGATFGSGCSIAALCDIRIASSKAKFGFPFGKRGLIADWGANYTLPRLIGTSKAIEYFITGRTFDAQTALQMGFVNIVVEAEKLQECVSSYCRDILQNSPLSVMECKALMYAGSDMELNTILEKEASIQSACYCSDDHREGVDCFLQKRDAKFTGK